MPTAPALDLAEITTRYNTLQTHKARLDRNVIAYETKLETLEAQRTALLAKLSEQFGVDGIEAGVALAVSLRAQLTELLTAIEEEVGSG
jgi:hypothetical protein